jgi:hypothetical protein
MRLGDDDILVHIQASGPLHDPLHHVTSQVGPPGRASHHRL